MFIGFGTWHHCCTCPGTRTHRQPEVSVGGSRRCTRQLGSRARRRGHRKLKIKMLNDAEDNRVFIQSGSHGLMVRAVACRARGPGFNPSFIQMFFSVVSGGRMNLRDLELPKHGRELCHLGIIQSKCQALEKN